MTWYLHMPLPPSLTTRALVHLLPLTRRFNLSSLDIYDDMESQWVPSEAEEVSPDEGVVLDILNELAPACGIAKDDWSKWNQNLTQMDGTSPAYRALRLDLCMLHHSPSSPV